MVTNLKKSKKIRAFCYRMIATAALITAIGTAIMGREAIVDSYDYGMDMFSGTIYNFPEFRAYIGEMYNKAMIGYAGIGDDMGYPLTDSHAEKYALQAKEDFEDMVRVLDEDILYYIQAPGDKTANVQSNVSYPIFSEYDGHLLLPDDMMLCCYWDGESGTLKIFNRSSRTEDNYDALDWYYQAQYKPNREAAEEMKLILAVREDCDSPRLSQMAYKATKYQNMMITFVVSVIAWLLFGCFSLFSGKAGKKAKEEFGVISGKVLLEIKLVFIVLSVWFLTYNNLFNFFEYLTLRLRIYHSLWLYFPLGCLYYLLYVDIKQNGVRVFLNSLPVKGVCGIVKTVRKKPWYRRATGLSVSMLVGSVLLAVIGVYLLSLYGNWYYNMGGRMQQTKEVLLVCGIVMILSGIILFFCYIGQKKMLKDTEAIVSKLSDMKEGIENAPLQLSKYSLLATAASDLNELETGIERAVEQQNRSNKMRVELLTNVSHDLKTPLTSIINYADLLCEEELPETAAEYATALQGKAYRLKNMVQDVFDLSKATSGNLQVETAVIDLVKLIKQTLADMDERIQESGLTFKLNIAEEPLMIEADGEKLYRVFQNLFVNALQYSLENSRVHIQLSEESGLAVAKIKNTSRMELDFDTSEIVERFVRADSSRTTEGSGLGLSIVQSFVENCGGHFEVKTDADMFTACVCFPLSLKTVIAEPVEEAENELEGVLS